MKRDTVNYLMVGGFVLCMFLLLLVALYRITGRSANADAYLAFYRNVSGIHEGSKVCFGGYQIGQVESIVPDRHEGAVRFRVTMAVRHGWQIPADSVARIVMPAVLSDKQVDILPGKSNEPLPPGAVLASAEGSNVMETMDALAYEMKDLSEKSLRPLIASFNHNLDTVGKNLGDTLPELAHNTNRLIDSLNDSVVRVNALLGSDNRAHVDRMIANGDTIATNLVAVTGDFRRASGQLEQLLTDSDALVKENNGDVRQAVINLRDTLATMAQHMDAIVYNLEGTTRNMHEFTREIRENPGRLLRDQPPEETRPQEKMP